MRRASAALLVALLLPPAAPGQQERDKENFGNLMPAIGALDRGDFRQAIDSLTPLARDGTVEAQYVLGTVLETAPPPLRDLESARETGLLAHQDLRAVELRGVGKHQPELRHLPGEGRLAAPALLHRLRRVDPTAGVAR